MVNALALLLAAALGAAEPAAPAGPQARYDAALKLLLDGRLAEAALGFEALAADPAAAALAERARALAEVSRALDARGTFVLRAPRPAEPAPSLAPPAAPRPPRLDRSGRGELALYSTAYGIWTGVATGILLESDDPRAYAALALAGGGGGLALAIYGTRGQPMPTGRTQAIEAAANWGGLNGGLIAGLADSSARGTVGATLGAGLAGIAGAVALTKERSPSSGDVALATSGGMWGLAAGGLALTFVDDPDDKLVFGTLLGAADAGLLAMALAARRIDLSRGRSLMIDAGGLVGTLTGVAVPLFFESEEPAAYGAAGLVGMGVGLASAAVLTRGWDEDDGERTSSSAGPRAMPFVARAAAGGFTAGLAGTF